VRKRSESGGKQATHLALAAGWHWVALGGMVAVWGGLLAAWDGLLVACWWPLSEAEPPVPAGLCYCCCCFKPCFFLTILETAMRPPVVAGCSFNQY